jgi:Type IV secretion-system coupling protein DNA-binding domain
MLEGLTHGWPGVALAYAAVQLPMFVGLARARGPWLSYLKSPALAAPLVAVAGIGVALAGPVLSHLGATPGGLAEFALGATLSVTLGYAGGRVLAEDPIRTKYQRGTVVRAGSPRTRTRNSAARSARITLAGRPVPVRDETKHFKLIGTTGTGKSTAIQEILGSALERGDRAVVADPDGGYMNRFYNPDRGDVVLNPFDERSVRWDLFAEIKTGYDVEQLARSLIPDHEGADRSWRAYARTFFSAVTRQARDAGVTDVGELYRLLVIADVKELRDLVHATPAQPFLEEHNLRMFDSIRSVASSAVAALEHVAYQRGAGFSVREWVSQDRPGVLFMPYKAGQIPALRSAISGWMRLAIFETMDRTEESGEESGRDARRLWYVVDELDALGQIDGLKDALARLRKFGGRCVLGFQSIAQVSSTYGQGEAHTIVENCGNTLILRCSASEGGGTARFASQLIGEREVLRTTVSRSRRYSEMLGSVSHSEHLSVESAVLASEIERLPDLHGYLKYASGRDWEQVQLSVKRTWERHRSQISKTPASAAAPMLAPPRSVSAASRTHEGSGRD